MKVIVRCENCVGYGTLEREHPMPFTCHECDGTGELTYTETYDNLYEAEQDYINQNVIRIEGV